MSNTAEKRKTLENNKMEIKSARVIANYGDPGLDEDYHFDILSRYVIVALESVDRIVTVDRWFTMLAVVSRPSHLWIDVDGGLTSPSEQRRVDFLGNINIGLSSGYSSSSIGRIDKPYQLGESIQIRKLPASFNPEFFISQDPLFPENASMYNNWHTEGSSLPYFSNNNERILALKNKTINPSSIAGNYSFYLNKYQYEAMMLSINATSSNLGTLTKIFEGNWDGLGQVYNAHGGYVFHENAFKLFSSVDYEDVNAGNKQRSNNNECIPLVVTTPNSFPTAKSRTAGTISYNPTYATIVKG